MSTDKPTRLVGSSRAMQALREQIALAAESSITVLIRGETGTGKELVARAIHEQSARAAQTFVPFNCAGVPESLLESELFGHERGAFTGAKARRIGKFEFAGRGTIFLDEIGDLSLASQVKLLRVLEEEEVQPIGGNRTVAIHARVVAATNRDLDEAVFEGKFREDLFYRLSVLTIPVPPLRERREDIPELVAYFISRYSAHTTKPPS